MRVTSVAVRGTMPLAPLAVAFAIGIFTVAWVPTVLACALLAFSVAGSAILVALGRSACATALLLVAVAATGVLRGSPTRLPAEHVGRSVLPVSARVEGRLGDEPIRWAPERTRLVVDVERVDGEPKTGRVQVALYGEPPALTEGQRIAAELRLRRASGFRNPGVFDYGAHLARAGIVVVASGRAESVTPLDDPGPPWPVRVRRQAVEAMRAALPPVSAALLGGLLLGARTDLPREIDDAFRRAGVYHVLAVSGFNVALVASGVFGLLVVARAGQRVAALAAIVVVIGFAFVAGPEPSVLRAAIMAVLVLGALLLERKAAVLNSLALAAILILATRPGELRDPGFQLSFAATAGIVLAPRPPGVLLGMLTVSLAAQLAVLPIALAHFNQLSTIGVVANLIVVPLAAVATVVGLLGVSLAALSQTVADVAFQAVWPVLLALRGVVRVAAAVPGAVVYLPAPPWSAIAGYVAAVAMGLAAWHRRTRAARTAKRLGLAAVGLAVTAVALEAWIVLGRGDGLLRVTVLDVGQGDAIVAELPDGRVLLIDAGPGGPHRLDTGARVVAPFLWNRGVLRLAGTSTTHADVDHAGGMAAIRRLLPIGDEWAPGREGVPASLGGATIWSWSWSPGVAAAGERRGRNDGARVVRLELGLASFLLASDIGPRAEHALLAATPASGVTVLKVAHHGSRHSSTAEFLTVVRPAIAVISVGARNAYGHPAAATRTRLAAVGATTYRTDRDGAVILETDGRRLVVTRWATRMIDRYCLDPESVC